MSSELPEVRTGHFVMLKDLVSRSDLNLRAARVLDKSWTEAAQHPGRVPVEMVVGKESMWVKLDNLAGPILDPADMTAPPYNAMTPEERTEASLQMLEPPKLAPAPVAEAPPEASPALQAALRAGSIRRPPTSENIYESVEAPAPAPAPAPAAAAIPSSDHENPWDFSDSEDEPAPAPAADRRAAARATLRNMMQEHCPRPHYCIYCGSEGFYGDKCVPCGFYRGSHCFGPNGPLQKGDTLMGRKLAFVKWPWQGDPEAPYVRAGATAAADAEPEPKSKYAVDPPPVRAMTRDEVLGPNPCAEVCPKYPNCTAARLVAYVLGKVDHVTPGVESDFRYYLSDTEDWRKTRERIIEIHEAGEENAAEVLHEEYLVQHHTLCETEETRPAYLPSDWDGMKRRVKARQKKDKGAEDPEALAYPDSDADEDKVAAYLEAKIAALDVEAAPKPELSALGNPKPERKGDPWGVAKFFEQLLKELPYYHREEMAEVLHGETIKDLRIGEVIDGRNSYEKSLTVSLTMTPCEDSDDESEGDDDADQASVPAEPTTRTITLNTYITPYDDNNAGVWLVDDTGYEREMSSVGTIPCPGGEPVRSFNKARAYQCAQYVVAYLVHGRLWWEEY